MVADTYIDTEYEYAFRRVAHRQHSTRIRDADCGHVIDRTEPYVYTVYKLNGVADLFQFVDCEFCARHDNHY